MSTKERLAAGTALVALGVPDALDQLLELARGEPSVAISVASILRWLPWNARVAAFGQLRSLVHEPEQVAQLCDQLVVLRDVRAGESLWQALSDQSIDAASAHSLHMNLLRIHGIESYHGYIDPDTPHDPIGFQVDTVRKIALESEHEWQQRVALALLLQFDSTVALDVAQLLMDRETAKSSIRVDAFVTLLIGNSSNDARQLAVAKLVERDQLFAPTALRYLTGDAELLRSFADGHFHLPNLIAEQQDSELQSELPEELKVEHVEPFLRSSDGNVAARAAYLMAMLGDATHVDILINHWRHSDSRDDWNKLIYEAIATADDPRFVPILVEIYEDLSKNSPHLIRDYYWFIRSMKGPEVLKLRKRIRDEVGMDQLR